MKGSGANSPIASALPGEERWCAGAILAIAASTMPAFAVLVAGLDEAGNSALGTRALACLAEEMDWSVFGASGLPDERL